MMFSTVCLPAVCLPFCTNWCYTYLFITSEEEKIDWRYFEARQKLENIYSINKIFIRGIRINFIIEPWDILAVSPMLMQCYLLSQMLHFVMNEWSSFLLFFVYIYDSQVMYVPTTYVQCTCSVQCTLYTKGTNLLIDLE